MKRTLSPEKKLISQPKAGCICKDIKLYTLIQAVDAGASSVEAVVRQTGIGDDSRQGRPCRAKVEQLLSPCEAP
ncbi:(2Fe-2S)-binding protein [Desulfogranum mediterraneum]|uniref:(2Fe-2S)-binding protein n=1 Tax=Desulfogranum mediterraneum TaxID=160661 RepID=UPI00040C4328|nr:(2Fe-2S)-binding protein [Desulfogranum mediterraneum]